MVLQCDKLYIYRVHKGLCRYCVTGTTFIIQVFGYGEVLSVFYQ